MAMGKPKDYSRITQPQRKRDEYALQRIKAEYVEPLAIELGETIEGYHDMNPPEKFLAIMNVNSEVAPFGYSLPLDFGDIKGMVVCSGCVFSGDIHESLYDARTEGGVDEDGCKNAEATVYTEKFPWMRTELFATPRVRKPSGLAAQWLDECIDEYRSDYDKLPTAFKIGVIAQLVSQCVLVEYADACKFAASWVDIIEPQRILWSPFQSKRFGPRGWLLAIRDREPENELMRHCAKKLRESSPVAADLLARGLPCYREEASSIQQREEHDEVKGRKKERGIRARREKTEALVNFIEVMLPSQGYYVGRTGKSKEEGKEAGEKISWNDAKTRFELEYPDYRYGSLKTFCNSYYQAKKIRLKEV